MNRKKVKTSCNVSGVSFNPYQTLVSDVSALSASATLK